MRPLQIPTLMLAVAFMAGCTAPSTTTITRPDAAGPVAPSRAAASGTSQPETPAQAPEPTQFELRVKTLKKQCFGSAGCNVTYSIKVGYDGPELDPDVAYQVTYKVTGADDPIINTFTVQGTDVTRQEEEFASTPSSGSTLKAKVIEIEEQ
ncbi:hypothetical protein ACIBG7_29745 [Nonomuraea sp. NPDC050328]|uniref:hypothetical protein n=1 Tax=Nonomuraea sp. NPDC050328 TaxID=3364361 RepID=UPI0037992571